ncbi:MAG: hypothetical protein IKG35_08910 [Erysipelotrichaceae bacterium]|nr:hypothetical protein [Erysipelotrichaceae bacterium]
MDTARTVQNDEIEIDLREIFFLLLDKALIIILVTLLFATAAFAYTKFLVTPMYRSTTSIYVLNKQNDGAVTSSDLTASAQLTYDYSQLIKSRSVAEEVIKRLHLDMTPDALIRRISTSTPSNSRIINISVLDTNPEIAKKIADTVRKEAAIKIQEVTACEAVNMVDEANVPKTRYSPSYRRNVGIGGALGFVLTVGIIVFLHLSDDTIKTSDDVEKYLGLSTLGSIPVKANSATNKKKKFILNKKGDK